MFNLIMRSQPWEPGAATSSRGRMLEFTEQSLVERYTKPTLDIDKLASLPCLFMVEGKEDQIARVGSISAVRAGGYDIQFDVLYDRDVPAIRNNTIYANRLDFDMREDFEFSRNHWAVKNVDLYRLLYRLDRNKRQRPRVFTVSGDDASASKLASVMMPFSAEFLPTYEAIKAAATAAGFQCLRADDIWEEHAVIQDVVNLIDRAGVVICDCTGRNANVFYEAGIAHALGREVILITQQDADVPFDLRHLRYVRYQNGADGLALLTEAVSSRMRALTER